MRDSIEEFLLLCMYMPSDSIGFVDVGARARYLVLDWCLELIIYL